MPFLTKNIAKRLLIKSDDIRFINMRQCNGIDASVFSLIAKQSKLQTLSLERWDFTIIQFLPACTQSVYFANRTRSAHAQECFPTFLDFCHPRCSFRKYYVWVCFLCDASGGSNSGVTMGLQGHQLWGPMQKEFKRGPFSNHIVRDKKFGAYFWNPVGVPEIRSYATGNIMYGCVYSLDVATTWNGCCPLLEPSHWNIWISQTLFMWTTLCWNGYVRK